MERGRKYVKGYLLKERVSVPLHCRHRPSPRTINLSLSLPVQEEKKERLSERGRRIVDSLMEG
jgi:hypothetical protein